MVVAGSDRPLDRWRKHVPPTLLLVSPLEGGRYELLGAAIDAGAPAPVPACGGCKRGRVYCHAVGLGAAVSETRETDPAPDYAEPSGGVAPPEALSDPGAPSAPPEAPSVPSAWPIFGWTLGALVAYLVFAVIAGALTGADASESASESDLLIRLILGGIAGTLVGFVVVPAIALRRQTVRPPSWLRLRAGDIGLAAVILIASYGTLLIYTLIVEAIGAERLVPESTIEDDDFRQTALVAAVTGVLVIGVAPFAEEFLFRRFVLGGLRAAWGVKWGAKWGTWFALLISAALFSALHADLGSMIPFAVIGLIFGAAYLRSGSLTAPTLAHLVFNIIGFAVTTANRGIG